MSLVLVRVDDRLVHGQVMVGWRTFLGATQVLVASDRLAGNPSASRILRLSTPPEVGLVIDTVDSLVGRIMAGEFDCEKDILLFENLGDALRALDLGLLPSHVNIGGLRHQDSCIAFSPAVSMTEPDIRAVRLIIDRGVPVDIQMVPREKPINLDRATLDRRWGAAP